MSVGARRVLRLLLLGCVITVGFMGIMHYRRSRISSGDLSRLIATATMPSEAECAIVLDTVSSPGDFVRNRVRGAAAQGLYGLIRRAKSDGGGGRRRPWQLCALFIERHGLDALTSPATDVLDEFVVCATGAGALKRCAALLEPLLVGKRLGEVAGPCVRLAAALVVSFEKTGSLEQVEHARRLLVPVLWSREGESCLADGLETYLSCLAYLRNDLAKEQLQAVIDRFVFGEGAPAVKRIRCAVRCASLLAYGWEPSAAEYTQATRLMLWAERETKREDERIEAACLRSVMTTRTQQGGSTMPSAEAVAEALATTTELVSCTRGMDWVRPLVLAVHSHNLSLAKRYVAAREILGGLKEEQFRPEWVWWYHYARAWAYFSPESRLIAVEMMTTARKKAPPEFQWYLALSAQGMDAQRLLDELFE